MIAKLSTVTLAPIHAAMAELLAQQDAERAERERAAFDATTDAATPATDTADEDTTRGEG